MPFFEHALSKEREMGNLLPSIYDDRGRQLGLEEMGYRAFLLAISVYTAILICISALGASFSYGWDIENSRFSGIGIIVLGIIAIAGSVLAHSNDDATASLIGGAVCAGAFGLMLGPVVAMYTTDSVVRAFVLAAGVVLVTGFVGAILPQDLSAWGSPILAALLVLIGVQLMSIFGFGPQINMNLVDGAAIVLFAGIMVYDLNRAVRLDRTHDNAIDVAVSVFVNFLNIFIRILSLLGKKRN